MGNSQQQRDRLENNNSSSKISPQDVLTSASSITETSRNLIKVMNEIQYSTYQAFNADKRITRNFSIQQDLIYFVSLLEHSLKRYQRSQESCSTLADSSNQTDSIEMLLNQANSLLKFAEVAHSNLYSSTELILKSAQLIEYIELIENREKSQIKKLGYKKLLDQAQSDLNDSQEALENYLTAKLYVENDIEFSIILNRIRSLQANAAKFTMMSYEIPQEIN